MIELGCCGRVIISTENSQNHIQQFSTSYDSSTEFKVTTHERHPMRFIPSNWGSSNNKTIMQLSAEQNFHNFLSQVRLRSYSKGSLEEWEHWKFRIKFLYSDPAAASLTQWTELPSISRKHQKQRIMKNWSENLPCFVTQLSSLIKLQREGDFQTRAILRHL